MAIETEWEQRDAPNPRDVVRIGGRDLGRWPVYHMLFMLLSAVVIANGLITLGTTNFKTNTETAVVAGTPLTRFIPLDPDAPRFEPVPLDTKAVVVVAHGFAGSQQLMWPFASTFARNGYAVVTFDFPGHGGNGVPFTQDDVQRQVALDAVVRDTQQHFPGKPVVLLGHSMGSAAVVQYATLHSTIAATIAVSLVADAGADVRNLLVLTGAWEGQGIREQSIRAATAHGGDAFVLNQLDGSFSNNTAREVLFVPRADHLTVLWNSTSLRTAVQWVDQLVGEQRTGALYTDVRMPGMAVVVLGTLWFWWSLTYFMFRRREQAALGANLVWSKLGLVSVAAAAITPVALRFMPTDFIPIAIGGYVALHFAVYGLVLLVGVILSGSSPFPVLRQLPWLRVIGAMMVLVSIVAVILGSVTHGWWLNMWPPLRRVPWAFTIFILLVPFFVVDAWLVSGGTPRRASGAYALTKLVFVLSLVLATVINQNVGFILLIVPVIIVAFALFGLMGERITRRTGNPFGAALGQAALLAWLITVSFPMTR